MTPRSKTIMSKVTSYDLLCSTWVNLQEEPKTIGEPRMCSAKVLLLGLVLACAVPVIKAQDIVDILCFFLSFGAELFDLPCPDSSNLLCVVLTIISDIFECDAFPTEEPERLLIR
ncbi:hypothetical protein RRG08_045785 [Elysia crispata]|uniref:Uncharacterized protein n=1 Tax=Elysia crispata TaxID=231223 RepID=A0AAE1AZ22_9GAST|nr:hypothetical protein RRG08_045785 [Elysia crispata]